MTDTPASPEAVEPSVVAPPAEGREVEEAPSQCVPHTSPPPARDSATHSSPRLTRGAPAGHMLACAPRCGAVREWTRVVRGKLTADLVQSSSLTTRATRHALTQPRPRHCCAPASCHSRCAIRRRACGPAHGAGRGCRCGWRTPPSPQTSRCGASSPVRHRAGDARQRAVRHQPGAGGVACAAGGAVASGWPSFWCQRRVRALLCCFVVLIAMAALDAHA
jgi:hypothetical protein